MDKKTVMMNSMNTTANILVVDDDPLNRRLVAQTLAHAGFATAEAGNGEEAMTYLNTEHFAEHFDAVVSDVQMPRMDGIELLQNIRARFPCLPVILMTGAIEDEVRQAAAIWGALALFQKPVNHGNLILALKTAPYELAASDCEFFPSVEFPAGAEV